MQVDDLELVGPLFYGPLSCSAKVEHGASPHNHEGVPFFQKCIESALRECKKFSEEGIGAAGPGGLGGTAIPQ